jgi:predicted O-methyltransferase YrrM
MEKLRELPRLWRRRARKENEQEPFSMAFYSVWEAVPRFAAEIKTSDFMVEMTRRRAGYGTHGLMGALDCATVYALTRWQRPAVVVESGGFVGMSSAFILKAFVDEGLTAAKLYSIEWNQDCPQGALVPEELRSHFVPLRGKVEDFVEGNRLPASIDMFLHDSSHSRWHMLWEFRKFWTRLRDRGLLVSHDVHLNAAFPEFVAETYAHVKKTGRLDTLRTSHYEWGRWGYIGFVIKKESTGRGAVS